MIISPMKRLISLLYVLFVVFAVLFFSRIINLIDVCEFYSSNFIFWAKVATVFIVLPLSGFLFSYHYKIRKTNWMFYWAGIPMLVMLFIGFFESRNEYKYIIDNATMVKKAYVQSTYMGKNRNSIKVKYRDTNYYYTRTISYRLNFRSEDFSKGDSLLVLHVDGCPGLVQIFSAYPTPDEWAKCKEYGYLIDGKLYSKEEYEKMLK